MTGRHASAPRHATPADDWPVPLDEVTRLAQAAQKRLDDHRAHAPAPVVPDLPPIPDALRPAAERWATPPGSFDDEVLHTVRLGDIRAEPPTWGGRGVRL